MPVDIDPLLKHVPSDQGRDDGVLGSLSDNGTVLDHLHLNNNQVWHYVNQMLSNKIATIMGLLQDSYNGTSGDDLTEHQKVTNPSNAFYPSIHEIGQD